jgi:hypothetical protein
MRPNHTGAEYRFELETDDNSARGDMWNYFAFGVGCAEVEVDCLTGTWRAVRCDVIMDGPGRLGAFKRPWLPLWKSILCGAFAWEHRALNCPKWRFPARAVGNTLNAALDVGQVGFGRVVAWCCRASTPHQIREHSRCLCF